MPKSSDLATLIVTRLRYWAIVLSLLATLQACQAPPFDALDPQPNGDLSKARLSNTVVYNNDFEGLPTGWLVYVWGWMPAYATPYAGSKRLDVANLMSRVRPNEWVALVYQTDVPLSRGNYLMYYSTLSTPTTIPNAQIEIRLVESAGVGTVPTEKLIGSILLKSKAVPLTQRKLLFSVAEGTQQCALKIVSVGNTTLPTEAGHCYIDDVRIVH